MNCKHDRFDPIASNMINKAAQSYLDKIDSDTFILYKQSMSLLGDSIIQSFEQHNIINEKQIVEYFTFSEVQNLTDLIFIA